MSTGAHKPRLAKNMHMVREGRLSYLQRIKELTGALLAALQQLYDLKAVLVCESLEDLNGVCLISAVLRS